MVRSASLGPVAVALVIAFTAAVPAGAQPCVDYGAFPHATYAGTFHADSVIDADGVHACCATRERLDAQGGCEVGWFSITPQRDLVREGTFVIDATGVDDVVLAGDLAVVAADSAGVSTLRVVDFATPTAPTELSRTGTPAPITSLAVAGATLYAGVSGVGLWIVDLTDPAAPTPTSTTPIGGQPMHVALQGDLCWVGSTDLLTAVDVSNPVSPSIARQLDLTPASQTVAEPRSLAVDGDLLAMTVAMDLFGYPVGSATRVYDIGTPSSTVLVFERDDGTAAEEQSRCAAGGGRVYSWRDGGYELSACVLTPEDELAPVFASDTLAPLSDVAVLDGFVLTAGDTVASVPVRDADPQLVLASVPRDGVFESRDLTVAGDLAIVQDVHRDSGQSGDVASNWVNIFDVSDPLAPAFYETTAYMISNTTNRYLFAGDYIYTSELGVWRWSTGTQVSLVNVNPSPLAVIGRALYVHGDGLDVYDLVDPERPSRAGTYPYDVDLLVAAPSGDRAYAAVAGALDVLDVSQPLQPDLVGAVADAGGRLCGVVGGGRLYLGGPTGVDVYGLADPDHPQHLGGLGGFRVDDIVVSGDVAYLASDDRGLVAVDCGDASAPVVLGRYDRRHITEIELCRTTLLTCSYDGQLTTLALDCSDPLPVVVQDFAATWEGGGFRLAWRLGRDVADLRLDASAGGRSWTVPWQQYGAGYAAVDLAGTLRPGERVTYVLSSRDGDGARVELSRTTASVPALATALLAPRPNPFNPATTLVFTLERPDDVTLTIHDLSGREVRRLVDGRLAAGRHAPRWDGRDGAGRELPAGVYVARLRAGNRIESRKLSLVK